MAIGGAILPPAPVNALTQAVTYRLRMEQPYTISCWYKIVSPASGNYTYLPFAMNSDAKERDLIQITMSAGGGSSWLLYTLLNNVGSSTAFTYSVTTGNWIHVAMVRETSSILRAYVDGALQTSQTRDVSSRGATKLGYITPRANNFGTWAQAHFKAWTTALDANQIKQEMWSFEPRQKGGLIAWQPMIGSANGTFGQPDLADPRQIYVGSGFTSYPSPALITNTRYTPMIWWMPPATTTSIIPLVRHHMAQQGMA